MAEGILRVKLNLSGISSFIDSCGFESFHVGDAPDPRAIRECSSNYIDISEHRARLFKASDLDEFDYIFVMDSSHYRNVMKVGNGRNFHARVDYILNEIHPHSNSEVMDPWYHDQAAFHLVFNQLSQACENFVSRYREKIKRCKA